MQRNKSVLALAVLAAMAGPAFAGDVVVSGFLTVAGGAVDDEDDGPAFAGYSEEDFTFDADTLFGLQVSSAVTDKLTVTGQLVARGAGDYEVDAEWAYVSYAFSDTFTGRMGRLRTPLYLYSDYVDVGYAYTWLRAPDAVYYLPFNNVQGIDFVKNFSAGSFDGSIQWYYGAQTDDFVLLGAEVSSRIRNQTGLALQVNRDWLTMRVAYHVADISNDVASFSQLQASTSGLCALLAANSLPTCNYDFDQLVAEEDSASFINAAIAVDTGTFVAAFEHVEFEIDDAPFSKDVRSYGMLGVRIGEVLLSATYQKIEDEEQDLLTGIPTTTGLPGNSVPEQSLQALRVALAGAALATTEESEINTIGLRWDFTSSAAFKIQLDDYSNDATGDQKVLAFGISTVF